MSDDERRLDEARRVAHDRGLQRLSAQHLAELAQSIANNRRLSALLPQDLHWTEECAHVFRLSAKPGGER